MDYGQVTRLNPTRADEFSIHFPTRLTAGHVTHLDATSVDETTILTGLIPTRFHEQDPGARPAHEANNMETKTKNERAPLYYIVSC